MIDVAIVLFVVGLIFWLMFARVVGPIRYRVFCYGTSAHPCEFTQNRETVCGHCGVCRDQLPTTEAT